MSTRPATHSRLTRRRAVTGLAAALVLAGTSACGSSDAPNASASNAPSGSSTSARQPLSALHPASDPRTITGPSTATLADANVEPVVNDPQQHLPTTVISHDHAGDKSVTIKDTSRVVAINLSGSIAATVQGLGMGKTLVARDQSTTFPSAAKLPLVTSGGHSVNAEAVLATKPTLVITDGSIGPRDVIEQLRDAGVTVVFVKNTPSFAGASQLVRDVAAIYGVKDAGDKLASRIEGEVAAEKKEVAAVAPKEKSRKLRVVFIYVRGNAGIYYLFGKGSGADDLIDALGARDVASEEGWQGMRPMTDEAITRANPDLVLVMTKGIASAGGVDGLLRSKPALALTAAGKNKRFVDMADGDILSFGPRSADVIDSLARAVYAPKGGQ